MIRKLAFPLLAAALVQGQLVADTYLEDVPALASELVDEVAFSNETLIGREADLKANKYGVYLERVSLIKCPRYTSYLPYFYGGLVANSRAWKTYNNERFTSLAVVDSTWSIVSSSFGPAYSKLETMYHTWEMLHFDPSHGDIRTKAPGTVVIHSWNAMQQLYIPLYLSSLSTGNAYMLHIYPEPSFLANPYDYTYADGLLWAKGSYNKLYRIEIDLEGMIKNLENFAVPNYKKYITAHGVVLTSSSVYAKAVAFSDHRQISLKPTTQGSSTEYICNDSYNSMDMSWSQMASILRREFVWL